MRSVCRWLPLLLLASLARAQEATPAAEDDLFRQPDFGFELRRPAADWKFIPPEGSGGTNYQLLIQPPDSIGQTQFTLRALRLDLEPAAYRKSLLQSIEGQGGFSELERIEREIAGQMAPGIRIQQVAQGMTYKVRQLYLKRHGLLYVLQAHAPVGDFDDYLADFDAITDSFAFVALSEDRAAERDLAQMAERCGSEVGWAKDWSEASARARDEGKLIFVYIRQYPGFTMWDENMATTFMDTDVIGLLNTRYVPLHLKPGMDAPMREQSVYGMSGSTFGQAMLLCDEEGQVLLEDGGQLPWTTHDLLLRGLKLRSHASASESGDGEGRDLDQVAELLRRGEYWRAQRQLAGRHAPRAELLRADLYRRQRLGDLALEAVQAAESDPDVAADAQLLSARLSLRTGAFEQAKQGLTDFQENFPEHESLPESEYWAGALALRMDGASAARPIFESLIERFPDNRWAWRAAGHLHGESFDFGEGGRLEWPEEAAFDLVRVLPWEPLALERVEYASHTAREFLLNQQSDQGSWFSAIELSNAKPEEEPSQFTLATTAICAQALLPAIEDDRAHRAVSRALDFLLKAWDRRELDPPVFFMDYSVWSHAYTISFLADAVRSQLCSREAVVPVVEGMLADLAKKQRRNGGWSYYITGDLSQTENTPEQSISFTTAAIVLALLQAEALQFELPEDMLARSLACLEAMRNDNGTFEYMLLERSPATARLTKRPGAAGRGPVCSLALYRAGREDLEALERRLQIYLDHREALTKERGKSLMHAGTDTQGSHYIVFDFATVAATIAELPSQKRNPFRRGLLEEIMKTRLEDGSYLDNPLLGRNLGAGLVLQALNAMEG